jgi:hypothetical protein
MASPFRCDNMASHGISRSPSLARVYRNALLRSPPTTRPDVSFLSIMSSRSLLSSTRRFCVPARSSSTNRCERRRFRSAFTQPFAGPCPKGIATDHELRFEGGESAPIRRLAGGLVDVTASKEILEGSIMPRDDGMLVPGALMFYDLKSRAVNVGVQGRPSIDIRFADIPHLGWTKRGAGLLCIEPRQGNAAPLGFAGDFRDKPGGVLKAANASARLALEICLQGGD